MNGLKLTAILFLTFWFAFSFAQPKVANGIQLKAKTELNQGISKVFFENRNSTTQKPHAKLMSGYISEQTFSVWFL